MGQQMVSTIVLRVFHQRNRAIYHGAILNGPAKMPEAAKLLSTLQ